MKPRHVLLVVALVVTAPTGQAARGLGFGAGERPDTVAAGDRVARLRAPGVVDGPPVLPPPATWPAPYVAPTTMPTTPPATAPLPTPTPAPPPVAPEPVAPATTDPAPVAASTQPPAVVARIPEGGVVVYTSPDAPTGYVRLRATTEFGTPRVLLTTLTTTVVPEPWVEVYLPTRPNGATGWVRIDAVTLETVPDRITVDLTAHTVTWERGGEIVGVVAAATGSARTPTPPGTYFVTDILSHDRVGQASPNGDYGAWVVALNGFSDAIVPAAGQEVRLAIHGTDEPASIGESVSSGCVRIGAAPLDALARNVPLGTPVTIR